MGIYSDYLNKNMSFDQLTAERKAQLKKIAALRGDRDVIVYASDITNRTNAPVGIDFSDVLPFQDQLANLKGKAIDIILETPGGIAEVVEDIVKLVRSRYEHVGVIIPGTAKSAGTIFSMAADEILMGTTSALGPIDAQIMTNNKRFSADAFLEGLEKIKAEVLSTGKLNPAYIPILQNISPGEIQHCENAQNFSKTLVRTWLSQYKFKYWVNHSSTGAIVTQAEKEAQAKKIADQLCKHSDWLTHGRSIQIPELTSMGLKITDFTKDKDLDEAIMRYYTLLKMTLESTNLYKIFETSETQIMRFAAGNNVPNQVPPKEASSIVFDFECPNCKTKHTIQAKLNASAAIESGKQPYPPNDIFICNNCKNNNNLAPIRLQIEAQTGKKIIQ
jgi:hypothetical protein